MPSCLLTPAILEQPHTAREYLDWAKSLVTCVKSGPDGLRQIRLRTGISKQLIEEVLPIGLFASRYFERSPEVEIALKVGNQSYDAIVRDVRVKSSGIEYLEVTMASEGELDYLRMLKLNESGQVSGLGRVTKRGTKKTGLAVGVELEVVSQQTILEKESRIISEAIERKLGKSYADSTALIIAFDDSMSYDRSDNQMNIKSVLQQYEKKLRLFHTVAVVGLVQTLFLLWERDAP